MPAGVNTHGNHMPVEQRRGAINSTERGRAYPARRRAPYWKASGLCAVFLLAACPLRAMGDPLHVSLAPKPSNQHTDDLCAGVYGVVADFRTAEPLAEARISLVPLGEAGAVPPNEQVVQEGVTNAEGRFLLANVKAGAYKLEVRKPGYSPLSTELMRLVPGKAHRRDLKLITLGRVSGLVLDELNNPVRGASVAIVAKQPGGDQSQGEQDAENTRAVTDMGGKFQLCVPADRRVVELTALALGYVRSYYGPLSVQLGHVKSGAVIRLSHGSRVQGRVIDEKGKALPGTIISVGHPVVVKDGLEHMDPHAITDRYGMFVLSGLEKGVCVLALRKSSYAAATEITREIEIQQKVLTELPDIVFVTRAGVKGLVADNEGRPIAGARVSARAGIDGAETISNSKGQFVLPGFFDGVRVRLSAEAPDMSSAIQVVEVPRSNVVLTLTSLGILQGRVEDFDTEEPVTEFKIRAIFGIPKERNFRSQQGTFEWSGLAPGKWTVVVKAPGYQRADAREVVISSGPGAIADKVVWKLKRGIRLVGRIVDSETGNAVPDVSVTYYSGIQQKARNSFILGNVETTDEDGKFEVDELPPETVTLVTKCAGYADTLLTLMPGDQDFVEIQLSRGAFLSGSVLASDRTTHVPRAITNLWSIDRQTNLTTPTDESGSFSFEGVMPGRYQLGARGITGRTQFLDIELSENDRTTGVTLIMVPGTTIHGTVTGITRGELQVADVTLTGASFVTTVSTNEDGTYAMYGVSSGSFKVMVQTSSFRILSRSIEISPETPDITVDFELPRESELRGKVTRSGQPVPFVGIALFPLDPQFVSWMGETGPDGTFNVDGLNTGSYVVRVGEDYAKPISIVGQSTANVELSMK